MIAMPTMHMPARPASPTPVLAIWLALCLALPAPPLAARTPPPVPEAAPVIPHVNRDQQQAAHWIARNRTPDKVQLDSAAIEAQNQRLLADDPSVHDLAALPATMSRDEVRRLVSALSKPQTRTLYGMDGQAIGKPTLDAMLANAALAAIPATVDLRYGLATARADLRTFPDATRVFSRPGDTDIDRFQETAIFPGTPVAVLHTSRDRQWLFVISPRYAAWMRADHLAIGDAERVLGYADKTPWLVVTGARVETVFNPDLPAVSRLSLEMGTRVPLLADWPADKPVNGQLPAAAHVIELPVREADGRLRLAPALLPHSADVATRYLPLTQRALLQQSFKFLGERYGWGHSYDARDCSGFVSEVYAGFGVLLPRNTSDQGKSPAFNTLPVPADMPRKERLALMQTLVPGDLVFIPGHVMMVIGHENGLTYVIHDTPGVRFNDGEGFHALNGVAVTPLEPLRSGEDALYIDRIYSIQRIRP